MGDAGCFRTKVNEMRSPRSERGRASHRRRRHDLGGASVATVRSVYCWYMKPTTVKLSIETRERIRALGGDTYEDTIVQALDVLEAERFWAQADAAAAWRRSLPDHDRERLAAREAEVDAAFDGIE